MEIPKLKFTKLWTNHDDFPTVETREEVVRSDMQLLFNEIRDYINTTLSGVVSTIGDTLTALQGKAGAGRIGFTRTAAIDRDNVQDAIERVQEQLVNVSQGGIADGAVTSEKVAAGAIGTAAIADAAVTYDKIKDKAVGSAKMADNAVSAKKIASDAVQERHIFNGAVTESKLAGESVTQAKIATAAVTSNKIAMRAVTKDKIADGAVTEEKLASDALDSVLNAYFLKVYPVGAFYFSASSDNPATLFGGTWTPIKDTFILAAGTKYKAGTTGGEATHTLAAQEMPNHYHDEYAGNDGGDSSAPSGYIGWPSIGYTSDKTWFAKLAKTSGAGGGAAHNNMPPYLAAYVWQRTA